MRKRPWKPSDLRTLRAHSKHKTRVKKISREMRRTVGALRQKAFALGISLGHQT